jgi:hypothetical protein
VARISKADLTVVFIAECHWAIGASTAQVAALDAGEDRQCSAPIARSITRAWSEAN